MAGNTVSSVKPALFAAALLCCAGSTTAAQLLVPAGATITLPSGKLILACADLTVQGVLTAGAGEIGTARNVAISGTLAAGSSTLTVGGNWSNTGTFSAGTSTVVFADGCVASSAQITGATAFANLTLTSSTGRTFGLPVAGAVVVSGALTLTGVPGSPIQLVSASPPQPASIVLGPGGSVSRTHVQLGTNVAIDASAIPRLANLSTRMQVLTGNDVMIAGFVIGGPDSKDVAVVVTGPSLAAFGIANPLANPTLTLVRSSDQAVIATNDDWQSAANQAALAAAGFAPTNPLESGLLVNLAPGAYTAIVQGVGDTTGVAVAGVYEVSGPEIPLVNISTRGRVLTGNDVMIGGFVIQGAGPQQVAIVATGPSLAAFGIASPLANPTLTLVRSSDQAVLATNDDWGSAANAAQLQAEGFAPTDPLEAAILTTLQPGAYTAIVQGVGGGVGVAVVGVYKVD